jgi:anti-anti-sigma regulatory factor
MAERFWQTACFVALHTREHVSATKSRIPKVRQIMLRIQAERFGDVAVIYCEGRIVQDHAAFRLRDAIRREGNARAIVVDLSDIESIEGGGLGMLLSLQKWSHDRGITFRVYDPPARVRRSLERFCKTIPIKIAGILEVAALLSEHSEEFYAATSKSPALSHAHAA